MSYLRSLPVRCVGDWINGLSPTLMMTILQKISHLIYFRYFFFFRLCCFSHRYLWQISNNTALRPKIPYQYRETGIACGIIVRLHIKFLFFCLRGVHSLLNTHHVGIGFTEQKNSLKFHKSVNQYRSCLDLFEHIFHTECKFSHDIKLFCWNFLIFWVKSGPAVCCTRLLRAKCEDRSSISFNNYFTN